jgi:hypothetical protein
MEHYLRCNHIPYEVVTNREVLASKRFARREITAAEGPSCQWSLKHVLEVCYQRGIPHLICAQYWAGSYYPYHCGPVEAYNITHAQGLWSVVRKAFTNSYSKACIKGSVGGTLSATIVRSAGASTGGIGIIAALGGGCVGGLVTFFWK